MGRPFEKEQSLVGKEGNDEKGKALFMRSITGRLQAAGAGAAHPVVRR